MFCFRMYRKFLRKRTNKIIIILLILIVLWMFLGFPIISDDEDFPDDIEYDIFIDETKDDHVHIPLDEEIHQEEQRNKLNSLEDPKDPIILWWTEFTRDPGTVRSCGERKCFFTNNRNYKSHQNMKVFLFYGTDFSAKDLPLPRQPFHEWGLFHEESPKNNYLLAHENALNLFNHTCTFRRESDFPISTQLLPSLEWLEQKNYFKSTSSKKLYQEEDGLAPVLFVQSDCDPPSDRDAYVKLLMKYIPVDSYGQCLNNKQLPKKIAKPIEGMAHKDFYELVSRYKFAIAMENAVCKDYMTEKLWRPLMAGAVPIVFGSPDARDFLPDNNSALLVSEFKSAEQLGKHLEHLNKNDDKYEKLLSWKKTGVTNQFLKDTLASRQWSPDDVNHWEPGHVNYVEAFECHVCNRVHDNMEREARGEKVVEKWATVNHLGCPKRLKFDGQGRYKEEAGWTDYWSGEWQRQREVAKFLKECVEQKLPSCKQYIHDRFKRKGF